ncbi:MAG: hypothetical protein B7X86_09410 [Sphingobacteriales bacterium 17-39-43]|nr:MAG: hypothetical protein B7Y24_09325 [Sphingobacteriales bacterium 16-39-50]OZA24291.1 MAG: hypothetical protein B7X86_09410 [Sphingobacteriales bacterium 17-39-43]OZA55871.1 MAG: hypothetical protein B7X75_06955 [Sphingobacteriales bacterium 39-40-5]
MPRRIELNEINWLLLYVKNRIPPVFVGFKSKVVTRLREPSFLVNKFINLFGLVINNLSQYFLLEDQTFARSASTLLVFFCPLLFKFKA